MYPIFHHEVWSKYLALTKRLGQNTCIQGFENDAIALAQELAISVYHFRERARGTGKMKNVAHEELRQKVCDIADTRKHGGLKKPERTVTFSAALAYEVSDQEKFQFLYTEIWAKNKRFSAFDVYSTLQGFITAVSEELSVSLPPAPQMALHEAKEWAESYVTPDTYFAKNTNIKFYRRAATGMLEPFNPKEVKFIVF